MSAVKKELIINGCKLVNEIWFVAEASEELINERLEEFSKLRKKPLYAFDIDAMIRYKKLPSEEVKEKFAKLKKGESFVVSDLRIKKLSEHFCNGQYV